MIAFLFPFSQRWSYTDPITGNTSHAVWTAFAPDSRLSAPECVETLWSRDNHLGNGMGGYPNTYNWTIPDLPHEHCVLRARYAARAQCVCYFSLSYLSLDITSLQVNMMDGTLQSTATLADSPINESMILILILELDQQLFQNLMFILSLE